MKRKITYILAAVLMAGCAIADTIAVGNASFESPATTDAVTLEDAGTPWSGKNGLNSWTRIYDVTSSSRQGTDYVHTAHEGGQVMQSGKAYHTYQQLTNTYVEGWIYTFSVWAAQGSIDTGRLYIYLADGTNLTGKDAWTNSYSLAYTRIDMAADTDWAEYSVSYTATTADAGKPIGINIYASYYGSCVDDVTVTAAPYSGGAVPVGNASFESPDTDDDEWLEDAFTPWSGENGISSWSRIYDVASTNRQGSDYVHTAHEGGQAMQSGKKYHSYQKLAQTYVEGWTYTFSVWAAQGTIDIGRLYIYLADASTGMVGKDAWSSSTNSLAYTRIDMAAGADWAKYSVSYTATAADAGKSIGINIYASWYGSCVDNVSVMAETIYNTWAGGYGLTGTDAEMAYDYDKDGFNNLYEYGLGGDPTNALDQGYSPVYVSDGSWFNYVYPQRSNTDSGLSYHLETRGSLVYGAWTNADYEVFGTNTDFATGFYAVSNRVSTAVKNEQFIRLIIEEE